MLSCCVCCTGCFGSATHSHLSALRRWHTEPWAQHLLLLQLASSLQLAVPPHAWPAAITWLPLQRSSAAVGMHLQAAAVCL